MTGNWIYYSVASVFMLLGLWLVYRGLLADRSRGRARCPGCWYDLRGLNEVMSCPECGRAIRGPQGMYRTRRRWAVAVLGAVVLSGVWYSDVVRWRMQAAGERWYEALVPTTVSIPMLFGHDDAMAQVLLRRCVHPMNWGRIVKRPLWRWQEWLVVQSCNRWVIRHTNLAVRRHALWVLAGSDLRNEESVRAIIDLLDDSALRHHAAPVVAGMKPHEFHELSDERLCHMLDVLINSASMMNYPEVNERVISEVMRRPGRPELVEYLERRAMGSNIYDGTWQVIWRVAHHRLKGQPDPIGIAIVHDGPLTGTMESLPKVTVRFTNQDVDQRGVLMHIPFAGSSMVHGHFRFRIRRLDDKELTDECYAYRGDGKNPGTYRMAILAAGESAETELAMDDFVVNAVWTGDFSVVVEYYCDLDNSGGSRGLMLESAPVRLTVK